MESKLLDMRECSKNEFKIFYGRMLEISMSQQPLWFQPLLKRSSFLQKSINYNHWSRNWEYPWAIIAAELKNNSFKTLDVGGGGSPFAIFLAENGCDSIVCDPSLNEGLNAVFNSDKGIYRNIRSLIFHLTIRLFGIKNCGANHQKVKIIPWVIIIFLLKICSFLTITLIGCFA